MRCFKGVRHRLLAVEEFRRDPLLPFSTIEHLYRLNVSGDFWSLKNEKDRVIRIVPFAVPLYACSSCLVSRCREEDLNKLAVHIVLVCRSFSLRTVVEACFQPFQLAAMDIVDYMSVGLAIRGYSSTTLWSDFRRILTKGDSFVISLSARQKWCSYLKNVLVLIAAELSVYNISGRF